jgi:hypothetical protein
MLSVETDRRGWYRGVCEGVASKWWCRCPLLAARRAIEEAAFIRRTDRGGATAQPTATAETKR